MILLHKYPIAITILLITVASIVLLLAIEIPVVEVYINGKPAVVYVLDRDSTHNLTIRFVHSVEKTWVVEYIEISQAGLYLVKTTIQSCGAGLESAWYDLNGTWILSKRGIIIITNRFLGKKLTIGVTNFTNFQVYMDGKLMTSDGVNELVVSVKEASLLEYLIFQVIKDGGIS